MDIIERITELRLQKGWSVNNLALEAGLTQSTLNSVLKRGTAPKIDTLQCICDALGISMSQFFLEDESIDILSPIEKEMLQSFRNLSPNKQNKLVAFLK